MKSIGLYPGVRTDTAGPAIVSQAGAVGLVETVQVAGLDRALSQALAPWRRPHARHDPGKILLDLALSLAVGGDCLADVAVLRDQPGVFGSVASDPTVSRLVDTLAADAAKTLAAVDAVTSSLDVNRTPPCRHSSSTVATRSWESPRDASSTNATALRRRRE